MKTYVTFYRKYYPNGESRIWTGPYVYAKSDKDLRYILIRLNRFFPNLQVAGELVEVHNSKQINKSAYN